MSVISFVQRAVIFILLFSPVSTWAQTPLVPCSGLDCKVSHIFDLLVNIYNYLLALAALVAMLMLVWGGIQMLIFYFDESPVTALEGAKNTIRRAIFGLVIILMAYLIVNTILGALGLSDATITNIFSKGQF